jgi:hypothetical protein
MKQLSLLVAVSLFLLNSGCKKDNTANLAEEIKNTTWTGEFKEARNVNEPFSLHFNSDNSFEWIEPDAATNGTYEVDNKSGMVRLTFSGGSNFSAKYTSDKKLSGIVYGGNYPWAIKSIAFNASPDEALAGTFWSGDGGVGFPTLQFVSATELIFEDLLPPAFRITYTRQRTFIRFSPYSGTTYFGVVNGKVISGISIHNQNASYAWSVRRP